MGANVGTIVTMAVVVVTTAVDELVGASGGRERLATVAGAQVVPSVRDSGAGISLAATSGAEQVAVDPTEVLAAIATRAMTTITPAIESQLRNGP